ncbi:hypothetical protein BH11VER1_BH11VER1_09690 [soil metagenome]
MEEEQKGWRWLTRSVFKDYQMLAMNYLHQSAR